MNNSDIELLVRSYRFTVMILMMTIVGMFALFGYIVLMYVPTVVANSTFDITKQALNEVLDERLAQ